MRALPESMLGWIFSINWKIGARLTLACMKLARSPHDRATFSFPGAEVSGLKSGAAMRARCCLKKVSRLFFIGALLGSGCASLEVMSRTEPHYVEPKDNSSPWTEGHEAPGNRAYYGLLPLTIPFDIATSPIQFVILCAELSAQAKPLPVKKVPAKRAPPPPRIKGL